MYQINGESISDAEQRKYIRLYQKTKDPNYLTPVVKNNVGFIINCAKKYSMNNAGKVHQDDLVSAGYRGMIKAAENFDMTYDNTFLTYAKHWIYQYINREFKRHCRTVRIPKEQYMKNPDKYRMEVEIDSFELQDYIEGILEKNSIQDIDKFTQADFENVYAVMTEVLTEKELDCVSKRFGLNHQRYWTLEELAGVYMLSRERIRQIINGALYKIARKLDKKKKRSISYEKKMHIGSKLERFN